MSRTVHERFMTFALTVQPVLLLPAVAHVAAAQAAPAVQASPEPRPSPKPQPRPHGSRVRVDSRSIDVDDGDTVVIHWSHDAAETIRILGIDTPETRHLEH